MRRQNGKREYLNRTGAVIIILLLTATVFLAAFSLSSEAAHTCHDEDCPVCALVKTCDQALHQLSDGLGFISVACMTIVSGSLAVLSYVSKECRNTPVSLKIRLDN